MGDHFQVLKVSEGTCTGQIFLGVGDHSQVLTVSEGTCTVLRTYNISQILYKVLIAPQPNSSAALTELSFKNLVTFS